MARQEIPATRFDHAAISLGGKIYVIGGRFESDVSVLVYNPARDG